MRGKIIGERSPVSDDREVHMRPGKFDAELTHRATVAAEYYGMPLSVFIRMAVHSYCDELAVWNPNVRAAYDYPEVYQAGMI